LLRLDVAAALAFPDGTVSALTLRREVERGRLRASRIGGRLYTTLSAIRDAFAVAKIQPSGSAGPRIDTESALSAALRVADEDAWGGA
jgi:hypothetical protein